MTRRDALLETLRLTARLAVIAPITLFPASCASAPPCDDVSMLSTPDQLRRTSLEYASVSPKGATESCSTCKFFQPANEGPCGTCSLVPGPVAPGGRCNLWADS